MGRLVYTAIASLDGYTVDADGDCSWAAPDEEVRAAVNDLLRDVGTHLHGRRIYEVMAAWETAGDDEDDEPVIRDFAPLWRRAARVVYSTTLDPVAFAAQAGPRPHLEPVFDPAVVRAQVEVADHVVGIGGPGPERSGRAGWARTGHRPGRPRPPRPSTSAPVPTASSDSGQEGAGAGRRAESAAAGSPPSVTVSVATCSVRGCSPTGSSCCTTARWSSRVSRCRSSATPGPLHPNAVGGGTQPRDHDPGPQDAFSPEEKRVTA